MARHNRLAFPNRTALSEMNLKDMLQLGNNLNLKRRFRSQRGVAVHRLCAM
jgi:hypothetical protein